MSHYLDMKVPLTDCEAIVRSLGRMGIPRNAIEVHEKPVTMNGYGGQTRKANIVVRKRNLEKHNACSYAYADLGFVENKDGTYTAYVDDSNFNKEWVNKMATYHHVEKAKMALDEKKITYKETVEKGLPTITASLPFRKRVGTKRTLGFSS